MPSKTCNLNMNMNWGWPASRARDVLTEAAANAEARLNAIKKAAKSLKKGVDESLKTIKGKNEELEVRKKRTSEYVLGEHVACAVQALNEERVAMNVPQTTLSPLNTVLERLANLEKTIGHMQAVNETEISTFMNNGTAISKLINEEAPAVVTAKKDLEQLFKRQVQSQNGLEKEQRRLERMHGEAEILPETIKVQQEKTDRLEHELELLKKDVKLEQDRLTSTLLTLVSRENRYAQSVFELIKIKKMFYENAFKTIEAELPNIERILQETNMRPVFGERIEDHLRSTGRTIAFPIALTVRYLLDTGLTDEGLFRISPKQIKLDKFKAHIDSHNDLAELLEDSDCHLHSSLLKSYLRELPVPLLGDGRIYDEWIRVSMIQDNEKRCKEIKTILQNELSEAIVKNIQYVVKFLHELSAKSHTTKMTPRNIGIVMGPTLLWSNRGFQAEHSNLENIISVVVSLVENYPVLFPEEIDLDLEETGVNTYRLRASTTAIPSIAPPTSSPPPTKPPRPISIPAAIMTTSALPAASSTNLSPIALSVESLSPNHKRKSSIRTLGRNFISTVTKQPHSAAVVVTGASHLRHDDLPTSSRKDEDDEDDSP